MTDKETQNKYEEIIMQEEIQKELKQFEQEYGIKIISARDTGSRAWKLNSPESDYDVSFIYIQDHEEYITPSGYKQNIDRESKTEYDIEYNSWNLDRYLALLKSSNPSAIEFLQSSQIYYQPEGNCTEYMQNLETHARNNFKPLALMMHHHSLAKNQYERYLKDAKDHTYKRHLYAIRSLLYREYLKNNEELPSINFPKFFNENQSEFGSWRNYSRDIQNMIGKKQKGHGNNTVRTRKIAKKIGKTLKKEIPDEKKQDYAQQNIDTEYLNQETEQFIKELNHNPCTWRKCLKSTWKELTSN